MGQSVSSKRSRKWLNVSGDSEELAREITRCQHQIESTSAHRSKNTSVGR